MFARYTLYSSLMAQRGPACPGSGAEAEELHDVVAEYDEEGVFVYQAYNDAIADWALENGRLGGCV